jgi:hypothetical protein
LQQLKRGTALIIERNDFAIHNAFACRQVFYGLDDFRESSRQLVFISGQQRNSFVRLDCDQANAVKLEFIDPIIRRRRFLNQLRFHWLNETRLCG